MSEILEKAPGSSIKAAELPAVETTTEADQSSSAPITEQVELLAQLHRFKEELFKNIELMPDYSAPSRYRSVEFCWTAMKLVSELPSGSAQGVEYIKSQIWSKDGKEVDIAACVTFEEMIYEFCTGIVQNRSCGPYDEQFFSSILELAQNRCMLSKQQEIHLSKSPSTKSKYAYHDYKLLKIVSLVPQLYIQERSDFWNFASKIMGDDSLQCYGTERPPPLKANEFLVFQAAVASEFNKFKIAFGTEKISNADGCFRQVERNLHEDVYAPLDDVLDHLPSLIEDSSVNQYNQSLLNLHLFLHRLFDQSDLGPRWLETPYWNHHGILPELPIFDKLGRNIEENMQKQAEEMFAEEDAYDRRVEAFNGWAPGDRFGLMQHVRDNAVVFRQAVLKMGCKPDGDVDHRVPASYDDDTSFEMRNIIDTDIDSFEMRNIFR